MAFSHDVQHVLHFFGHGGYDGGDFTNALLHAIAKADEVNRQRLRVGFPGMVALFELGSEDPLGIGVLMSAARFSNEGLVIERRDLIPPYGWVYSDVASGVLFATSLAREKRIQKDFG